MNQCNKATDQLRAVEYEVDNAYRKNPLALLPRPQAVWYFLTECEERYIREAHPSFLHGSALSDELINLAKWPMRWLWRVCDSSGGLTETIIQIITPQPRRWRILEQSISIMKRPSLIGAKDFLIYT